MSNKLVPKPQGWGARLLGQRATQPTPGSAVEAKLEENTGPKMRPTHGEAGELGTSNFRAFY